MCDSIEVQCDMCRFRNNDTKLSAKPKRALSAYNIFFRDQRERILRVSPQKGVGGFGPLARNVASKWKQLGSDDRKYFEELAKEEKERYKREMEQWKKDYRTLEACHAGVCTCTIKQSISPNRQTNQTMGLCIETGQNVSQEINATTFICSPIIPTNAQSAGINTPEPAFSSPWESAHPSQEAPISVNLSVLFSQLDDDCLDVLSSLT